MPKNKDYDDELVELLGRAELSEPQIAERVGLSSSQVGRIARGDTRPDLQPRINAAMRRTLKEAWKNGGRLATESGDPLPGRTAHAAFDRYLAVELISAGQLTLRQIAKRLGVNKTTVWGITSGRTHPELQPLLRESRRQYRDRARRVGGCWSAQLVMKQIQVGLKDEGWLGMRTRQSLLDRFLGPENDDEVQTRPEVRPFSSDLEKLPERLQNEVIAALGGPVAEDEENGD